MKAELALQVNTAPGLAEAEALFSTLEQVLADAPHLRLQALDHLFTLRDGSLKPGLVELVAVPATGADGHSVIELKVSDRLRELVGALAAGDVEVLGID